jgi:transposase
LGHKNIFMLQLKLRPHLTKEELKRRLMSQKDIRMYSYWQILNAVINSPGKRAQEIADVLGTSATILKRIVRSYNNEGPDFDKYLQWGGRRQATSFMSVEEEAKMMKQLESKALKGAILTFKDIKETVEKKLDKEVSDDYIWDLFKRNHWSKKSPRPKHPKQDLQVQETFKKNSLNYWQPASIK